MQSSTKSMSQPSPYARIEVGNVTMKTIVKPKTASPKWEQTFCFLVYELHQQELFLEVRAGLKMLHQ